MLMKCSHCRMPVSSDAKICPYCGKEPHPLYGFTNKITLFLIIFCIIIVFCGKIYDRINSSNIDIQAIESLICMVIGLSVSSYILLKKKQRKRERQRRKEQQINQQFTNRNSISEEITELSNLYKTGVLSEEEFEKAKQKILSNDK